MRICSTYAEARMYLLRGHGASPKIRSFEEHRTYRVTQMKFAEVSFAKRVITKRNEFSDR
jgi:hypothetical protein